MTYNIIKDKKMLLSELDNIDFSFVDDETTQIKSNELFNLKKYLNKLKEEIQLQNKKNFYIFLNIYFYNGFIYIKLESDTKFLHCLSIDTGNDYIPATKLYSSEFTIEFNKLLKDNINNVFNDSYYNFKETLDYKKAHLMFLILNKVENLLHSKFNLFGKVKENGLYSSKDINVSDDLFDIMIKESYFHFESKALNSNQFNKKPIFRIYFNEQNNDLCIYIYDSIISLEIFHFLSTINTDIEESILSILKINKLKFKNIKEFINHLKTIEIINY